MLRIGAVIINSNAKYPQGSDECKNIPALFARLRKDILVDIMPFHDKKEQGNTSPLKSGHA
jgi:hypothetical protein